MKVLRHATIALLAILGSTTDYAEASPTGERPSQQIEKRAPVVSFNTRRGLPWATDSRWAPRLLQGYFAQDNASRSVNQPWYWHWQDGPLKEYANTSLEYVPNFWGMKYALNWASRESEFATNGLPKAILAQNEIDVPGQANQTAAQAAATWAYYLSKWQDKGVRISSPQIVWNISLLQETRTILRTKYARDFDFVAIHYYGNWSDVQRFKNFVTKVRVAFPNKNIWITEIGVTTASNGTQAQIKSFHQSVFNWLDTQSYVERAAIFGVFSNSTPPDSYADGKNALFNADGSLRDLAYWYMWN